jgi:hypothetical protein
MSGCAKIISKIKETPITNAMIKAPFFECLY